MTIVDDTANGRIVRSGRAGDPVAVADRHGQRAGAGAAAGRLLADRARGRRPRQRRVRPPRPDGRPGGHRNARAHQLAGDRRRQHARRVPARDDRAGRRADHERSVQDRRPAARRHRAGAGVAQRQADRLLRFDDPPHRRRRLRHRGRWPRRVRRGPLDPDLQADEGRRAQRRRLEVHPVQRAPARPHGRRPARPAGVRRGRRPTAGGAVHHVRTRRHRGARRRDHRPLGGGDPRQHPVAARPAPTRRRRCSTWPTAA